MLQDFNTSSEINTQFQTYAKNFNSSIEFSIKILCKANWPTEKNYSLFLPKSLDFWKKEFDDFYKKNSSNYKVLEWIYSLSSLTIRLALESKTYEVTMSMYQAALLFLFENYYINMNIKEIAEKLSFPEDFCLKLLKSMVFMIFYYFVKLYSLKSNEQCKILEKKTDEKYFLNKSFTSNLKKFSIPQVSNKEKISKGFILNLI